MLFNSVTVLATASAGFIMVSRTVQAAPPTAKYSGFGESCTPNYDLPCEEQLICVKDEGSSFYKNGQYIPNVSQHRCLLRYRPAANDCTFNACSPGQVCVFNHQTMSGAIIEGRSFANGQCYNAVAGLGQQCGRGVTCVAGSTCMFGQTSFAGDNEWGTCKSGAEAAGSSAAAPARIPAAPPAVGNNPTTYPPAQGNNMVIGQLGDACNKSVGKLGKNGADRCAAGLQCKYRQDAVGFGYYCMN